jgi:hypothetical protein
MSFFLNKSFLLLVVVALWWPIVDFRSAQIDDPPKVIESRLPVYPPILVSHLTGTVVLELEILSDGQTSSAKALTGHPLLRAVSRTAGLQWRFEPSEKSLRKTRVVFEFASSDDLECRKNTEWITPFHVKVYPFGPVSQLSDTIHLDLKKVKSSNCQIHHLPLVKDKVEIIYGEVGFRAGYLEAEKKSFPNSHGASYGGCLREILILCDGTEVQRSPKFAEVLYCSKCRRAEARWHKKHSNRRFQV